MTRKKALVTGAAGFVGRHMVTRLLEHNYTVLGIDLVGKTDGEDTFEEHRVVDAYRYFATESDRFDLVVHAAASAPYRAAIDTEPQHFAYNLGLDAAMFTWAVRTGQGRVVYLSSSAAYPTKLQLSTPNDQPSILYEHSLRLDVAEEPDAVYGWTKLTGERLAKAARGQGLKVTVVRPFSGYGEDQTEDFPFGAIVERARRRENPLTVFGNGKQVRDFVHIDDITAAIMILVRRNVDVPVNLCTGIGTSISMLAAMAAQIAGYNATVKPASESRSTNTGVDHRVGGVDVLHTFYRPRVNLALGIARRLETT